MDAEASLRRQLCEAGKRLYDLGLVGANEGNLSVRLDGDCLLCTPAGSCKGRMEPHDIVKIDSHANPVGPGSPSSEIALHTRLFSLRPDCGAVVHAHPIYATALSLVGQAVPAGFLPEADYVLGRIALVPFAFPGTEEVPDGIAEYAADHKTFVLSHHGAVCIGQNLAEAVDRMEVLERVCTVWTLASTINTPVPLPEHQRAKLAPMLEGRLG